jgi:hypothetical protein
MMAGDPPASRTFQKLRWKEMPGALAPVTDLGTP